MNRLWILGTVAILSSCAVGPDYKRPQLFLDADIMTSLNLSGNVREIDKEWYKSFNDAFLNTLIARGLEDSPNVKIAIEKLWLSHSFQVEKLNTKNSQVLKILTQLKLLCTMVKLFNLQQAISSEAVSQMHLVLNT